MPCTENRIDLYRDLMDAMLILDDYAVVGGTVKFA